MNKENNIWKSNISKKSDENLINSPKSAFGLKRPIISGPSPIHKTNNNSGFIQNINIGGFNSFPSESKNIFNNNIFNPYIFPESLASSRTPFFPWLNGGQYQYKLNIPIISYPENTKNNNNFNEFIHNIQTEKNNILNDSENLKNIFNFQNEINEKTNLESTPNTSNYIHSSGTKFFTNHNYGYKCSCSKTQCNRKYCECFNSGNYCIDCNCKNCSNQPPINTYTNKHPKTDENSKSKKDKVICTCTKSGCNKNYCECFKNNQKCSSSCRCISCENNDEIKGKKNLNLKYECCPENSIYIIKNNIFIFDMKTLGNIKIKDLEEFSSLNDNFGLSKKRNREKNGGEEKVEKKKKIEENNHINDNLFDNSGNVILKHINLTMK